MPDAAYYAAHRDEIKAQYDPEKKRAYYLANREAKLAQVKDRYQQKRESILAYSAAYHEAHRDEIRAKGREYNRIHSAERVERNRRYEAERPEWAKAMHRSISLRRQARKRGAAGDASPEQIAGRVAVWGEKCWMCGGEADHIDHVKPLAKGGSNWPANLRPACAHCNKSKNDSWPFELAA